MERHVIAIIVLFLASLTSSRASVVDNWVICTSCSTDAQFQAAARSWYGTQKTREQVNVGNPNTGKVYQMWIQGGGSGVPLHVTPGEVIVATQRPLVVSADDVEQASVQPLASQPMISDYLENAQVEPAFGSLFIAHSNHILFNASSTDLQSNAFASYSNAAGSMEQICPRIWAEEDAVNPGFSSKMMSATGGMVLAMKSYFGHGILVSPVFGNGDVATFQINPLESNACTYVAGSAKDRYGKTLPDITPNVGGGGSGNVIVGGGGSDPNGGSYSVGGETWLVCSYSGSTLIGCYVTHTRPL
jgi:hypothetical protein